MGMAFCLSACVSKPVPIAELPSYGDPGPGTIHVLVRSGFERPGHYYLPKGTTLGLLIDVAGWTPVRAVEHGLKLWRDVGPRSIHWNFLYVQHHRGRDFKTDGYTCHLDKNGMPYKHRERLLLDGDWLIRSGIYFWTFASRQKAQFEMASWRNCKAGPPCRSA